MSIHVKLKNIIGSVLCMFSCLTLGCKGTGDPKTLEPGDMLISISVDAVSQEERIYTGAVFIGDATDEDFGNDPYFSLETAAITSDTLPVRITFSGGCRNHEFTLVTSGHFLDIEPLEADMKNVVALNLSIAHNANGDPCEAAPTEQWNFDLTPIKVLYQRVYQHKAGTIILRLKNARVAERVYKFAM